MVDQILAQDSPQGQADRLQAERERAYRAQLRVLADVAAFLNADRQTCAEHLAENARLLKAEAERQAMREGVRVYSDRRSTAGPAASGAGPSSVDQAARNVLMLSDAIDQTTAHVTSIAALGLTTYTNMGRAAIAAGLADAHRLYNVAQAYARTHQGRNVGTVSEWIARARAAGMSAKQARAALEHGTPSHFDFVGRSKDRRQKIYRMRAKERVCVALGIVDPGRRVLLPDAAFSGHISRYKAFVAEAIHVGGKSDYSRATLARLFGVTRRTHARWCNEYAKTPTRPRYSFAEQPTNDGQRYELNRELRTDEARPRRYWYTVLDAKQGPVRTVCPLDNANQPDIAKARDLGDVAQQAHWPKRDRRVLIAWREPNAYQPVSTAFASDDRPTGRALYIRSRARQLMREMPVITPREPRDGSGSSTVASVRRFENEADAAEYQLKHRTAPAKVRAGQGRIVQRSAIPFKPTHAGQFDRFRYSLFALAECADGNAQHMRQLQVCNGR